MKEQENAIWEDVLKFVQPEITTTAFNTWFKQEMHPLGIKNGVFMVGVRNVFSRELIKNTYGPIIEQALLNLGAGSAKVHFEVIDFPKSQQVDLFANETESRPKQSNTARLNPKYVFSNFVVGNNNNLAHAAAQAIAEAPGHAYNPLFIYGDAGLGKTHLMHAAGHAAGKNFPELLIEYITTEEFINDTINAIREDRMVAYRNRYRSVDMLLIDDVQFIAGKERTQEEFFHTFNSLYESGKQIIISSDRPPRDIPTLNARIRSRFEMGLITDIQAPELETRIAILKQNADNRGLKVPAEVIEFIATHVTSNIRELEGALIRVVVYGSMKQEPITRQTAAQALADVYTQNNVNLTMADLLSLTAKHFEVSVQDLKSKGRRKELVIPRQVAMYIIREMTTHSYPEIGQFFSGRDHSTVIHAVQKVTERVKSDPEFADKIRIIKGELI